MAGKVIDESRVDEIIMALDDLSHAGVSVGIIGNQEEYDGTGLSVLDIANIHEFGGGKIPERSFIRATYDTHKGEITDKTFGGIARVVEEGLDVDTFLTVMGQYGEDITRDYLIAMDKPPLKPATIKRKGSSSVLIDTGKLSNSISYEVKK